MKTILRKLSTKRIPNKISFNSIALMFPGQGSQHIGMGLDLYTKYPAAKDVFDQVDEALNENLSQLMFHGDPFELQKTSNAQPAILTHSMAMLAAAEDILPNSLLQQTHVFMGHSLGEFTAACAAGCFTLPDAVRLVRARGIAMEEAAENAGDVAMVAMMPLGLEKGIELCQTIEANANGGICQVANWNAGNQIVISGTQSAVQQAIDLGKSKYKVRRAIPLDVSAPFHCSLMKSAESKVKDLLYDATKEKQTFQNPSAPIVMNIDGSMQDKWIDIREGLINQTCQTVKWVSCAKTVVDSLSEHNAYKPIDGDNNIEIDANECLEPTMVIEIGPGKTLTSLMGRVAPKHFDVFHLNNTETLEKLIHPLQNANNQMPKMNKFDR